MHFGHSGGSGYASYMTLYCMFNEMKVCGAILSCGNASPLMHDGSGWKITNSQRANVPLYYSFGKNDPVCVPKLQDECIAALKSSHYKNMRVQYHQNKHAMSQDHLKEAIEWFKLVPKP